MAEPLEWYFKLFDAMSGPADKITGSLGRMEEALNTIAQNTERVTKGTKEGGEKLKGFQVEAGKLNTALGSIDLEKFWEGIKGGAIGAGLTLGLSEAGEAILDVFKEIGEVAYEAIEKVIEIGKEALRSAEGAEKLSLSFKLLLGEEQGEGLERYIESIRKTSAFSGVELKTAALELLRSGAGIDQIPILLGAAEDFAAFGGDLNSATSALSRIIRRGEVDERALGHIGVSMKRVEELLSKSTGKSIEEVKKLMEARKLAPGDVINSVLLALQEKEHGPIATAGVEASKTLDATLKRLSGLPEQYFETLSKSAGYEKFRDNLRHIADLLDPSGPFGDRITQVITRISDAILGLLSAGTDGQSGMDRLVSGVEAVVDGVEAAIPYLKLFVGMIEVGFHWAMELAHILGAVGEQLDRVGSFFGGKGASDQQTRALAFLEAAKKQGLALPRGLADGVAAGNDDLIGQVNEMADQVAGAARDRLKVHSPSAVFMDIGEAVGDGFAAGIEGSASATARAYGDLFGAPDSAGAGGGGGLTVVVAEGAIVIEIRGGNEKEIAAEVREVLPGALESAIAQLALQQGAKRG